MDTKHTPGPWEILRARDIDGEWSSYINAPNAWRDHSEFHVCKVFDQAEWDAHLIAAAPELLEALREIHNIAATPCLPENVSEDWPTVLMRRLGEIRHVSQKAVARAEGR